MELAYGEETDQATLGEKEHVDGDGEILKLNQTVVTTKTTEETANYDGIKETDKENATGEEEHVFETVFLETTIAEETDEFFKDVGKGESKETDPNGQSVANEVNKDSNTIAGNEKTETEENSKKHPLIVDEAVSEPEAKKIKIEDEQVVIDTVESPAWELPFPQEFYAEMETYDCDPGPLWHFDDPYFIELAEVGNPPKDVAFVSLKHDKDA